MDEALVKRYRELLKGGFKYSGKLENPSIFLDSTGERLRICAHAVHNYIYLYIDIKDNVIEDIKYLCQCTPATNVAVEILCGLVKGKTLEEAKSLKEDDFARELDSREEDYMEKARGAIELFNRAMSYYRDGVKTAKEKQPQ